LRKVGLDISHLLQVNSASLVCSYSFTQTSHFFSSWFIHWLYQLSVKRSIRTPRFHVDITEARTEEGKLHLFVAIDRTSRFAFAAPYDRATRQNAKDFLERPVASVPYRIHTVPTDNGVQFAGRQPESFSSRSIPS